MTHRYANRPPLRTDEVLMAKRETGGIWHLRDAQGELICKHQYRNDFEPGLRREGFVVKYLDNST